VNRRSPLPRERGTSYPHHDLLDGCHFVTRADASQSESNASSVREAKYPEIAIRPSLFCRR
jgi:hypothetical protein